MDAAWIRPSGRGYLRYRGCFVADDRGEDAEIAMFHVDIRRNNAIVAFLMHVSVRLPSIPTWMVLRDEKRARRRVVGGGGTDSI